MDSCRQRIDHTSIVGRIGSRVVRSAKFESLIPQGIFIDGGKLYWIGKASNNGSEFILSRDLDYDGPTNVSLSPNVERVLVASLTDVSGLSVYDANSQVEARGGKHLCDEIRGGIRLDDSCVCPMGYHWVGDSCKG